LRVRRISERYRGTISLTGAAVRAFHARRRNGSAESRSPWRNLGAAGEPRFCRLRQLAHAGQILSPLRGGEEPPVRDEGHVIRSADELDVQGLCIVSPTRLPQRLCAEEEEITLPRLGESRRVGLLGKAEQFVEGALPLEKGTEHDGGVREKPRGLVAGREDAERVARAVVVGKRLLGKSLVQEGLRRELRISRSQEKGVQAVDAEGIA
jgi:hypothetical protein